MRITNFLYCLNTSRLNDVENKSEQIDIGGILTAITPEFLPSAFSFSIFFSILDLDLYSDHNMQIVFKKETGEIISNTNGILIPACVEIDTGVANLPKEHRGINFTLDLKNVIFREEGVYQTEVFCDNKLEGIYPIYVKGKE